MRTLPCSALAIALAVAALPFPGSAASPAGPRRSEPGALTSGALIETARSAGVIADEQAIVLQGALAVRARPPSRRLPRRPHRQVRHARRPSRSTARSRGSRRTPPTGYGTCAPGRRAPTYYSTTHFRIHYDVTGTHMVLGWPDTTYRDAVATALENVLGAGGHGPRVPSASERRLGPRRRRRQLSLRRVPPEPVGLLRLLPGRVHRASTPLLTDCTSYIVIDNDYAGFGFADPQDPMKVTVAHEFSHACQFAHDYLESVWYMECTSTWIEDYVYDAVNDYRNYIPYFYNYPYALAGLERRHGPPHVRLVRVELLPLRAPGAGGRPRRVDGGRGSREHVHGAGVALGSVRHEPRAGVQGVLRLELVHGGPLRRHALLGGRVVAARVRRAHVLLVPARRRRPDGGAPSRPLAFNFIPPDQSRRLAGPPRHQLRRAQPRHDEELRLRQREDDRRAPPPSGTRSP